MSIKFLGIAAAVIALVTVGAWLARSPAPTTVVQPSGEAARDLTSPETPSPATTAGGPAAPASPPATETRGNVQPAGSPATATQPAGSPATATRGAGPPVTATRGTPPVARPPTTPTRGTAPASSQPATATRGAPPASKSPAGKRDGSRRAGGRSTAGRGTAAGGCAADHRDDGHHATRRTKSCGGPSCDPGAARSVCHRLQSHGRTGSQGDRSVFPRNSETRVDQVSHADSWTARDRRLARRTVGEAQGHRRIQVCVEPIWVAADKPCTVDVESSKSRNDLDRRSLESDLRFAVERTLQRARVRGAKASALRRIEKRGQNT